jgi:hypothetical protein
MTEADREALIARFSRGTLSDEEQRLLFEASLDDQELFDALAEEDALRDVLDDPEARRAVASRLARPAPRRTGWRLPAGLAAAASIAVLAVLTYRPSPPDLLQASQESPQADALAAEGLVASKELGLRADLQVGGGRRAQEPMRISVSVSADARLVLLLQPVGGRARILVPASGVPPPRVTAEAPFRLNGLRAPKRGHYQLMALVLADGPGLDLASFVERVGAGEAVAAVGTFDVQ